MLHVLFGTIHTNLGSGSTFRNVPFTVLKVSKIVDNQVDVIAEFPTEGEATKFVQDSQDNDPSTDHEYRLETPPSLLNDIDYGNE
jgi:hypothetical protein